MLNVAELSELGLLATMGFHGRNENKDDYSHLFVICLDREAGCGVLPVELDYALTSAGRHCVVRLSCSPSNSAVSTSQLREMAAAVSGELLSIGMQEWCRVNDNDNNYILQH